MSNKNFRLFWGQFGIFLDIRQEIGTKICKISVHELLGGQMGYLTNICGKIWYF